MYDEVIARSVRSWSFCRPLDVSLYSGHCPVLLTS